MPNVKVLVTGGAGYIGSITATALEAAGHHPIVLDSLASGPRAFVQGRTFYQGDIADRGLLRRIAEEHPDITSAIHMAASTVVPESVAHPYRYFHNNVAKSLEMFDELAALGVNDVIFSSSAAVYAPSPTYEVTESDPVAPGSPYAETKLMTERMLAALVEATGLRAVSLRYFNPMGADPDLRSGVHVEAPTHVLGQLVAAARGEIEAFSITGTDHPTRDGTGLRDYIHVWDLARAHVRVVERFDEVLSAAGERHTVLNLGTGTGTTVRELIRFVEQAVGRPVPVREARARPGDVVGAYARVERAAELLDWRAELTIPEAVESALAWADRRAAILAD